MRSECIVGIDGSDVGIDALRWAVRNAGHNSVVALSAWHVPIAMKALMAKRSWNVDGLGLAAAAGNAIDVAVEQVGDEASAVKPLVVEGHAPAALVHAGDESSLLVVGRHGLSDIRHLILGSVSRHCVTHASVPVVVVPPGFDRPAARNIVVGFDGSEHACAALRWAMDFFDAEAQIHVVAAIELSPWLDVEATVGRFPDEVHNEEQRITEALAKVDPDGRADCQILLHGVRQALAEASGTADIIVLGARGHGAIGSAMLGSVSAWMLHRAVCPVAIVPTRN